MRKQNFFLLAVAISVIGFLVNEVYGKVDRIGPNATTTFPEPTPEPCNTIEEQIANAEDLEDYAAHSAQAHLTSSDYWPCYYAAEAYENACNARKMLESLKNYLCEDNTLPRVICEFYFSCNQSH